MEFQKWDSMQWLLTNTHKVTSNTIINDALFSDISQLPINFEHSNSWCYHYW